jgi:hypothetical protein
LLPASFSASVGINSASLSTSASLSLQRASAIGVTPPCAGGASCGLLSATPSTRRRCGGSPLGGARTGLRRPAIAFATALATAGAANGSRIDAPTVVSGLSRFLIAVLIGGGRVPRLGVVVLRRPVAPIRLIDIIGIIAGGTRRVRRAPSAFAEVTQRALHTAGDAVGQRLHLARSNSESRALPRIQQTPLRLVGQPQEFRRGVHAAGTARRSRSSKPVARSSARCNPCRVTKRHLLPCSGTVACTCARPMCIIPWSSQRCRRLIDRSKRVW